MFVWAEIPKVFKKMGSVDAQNAVSWKALFRDRSANTERDMIRFALVENEVHQTGCPGITEGISEI
jgi:hypothetical protein